jgi:hypothetical protein
LLPDVTEEEEILVMSVRRHARAKKPRKSEEKPQQQQRRHVLLHGFANVLTVFSLLVLISIVVIRYVRVLEWTATTALAIASLMLILSILIFGYVRILEWTGLTGPLEKFEKRTLWDWLQLLIVPAVLGLGGLWFATELEHRQEELALRQEKHRDLLAARRERAAKHAEEQRAQDTMLLAYLDQMSQSLTNRGSGGMKEEDPEGFIDEVASARTITALRSLDGEHKRMVVRFVYEAELISKDSSFLEIGGANLSKAELNNMPLAKAELSNIFLAKADLRGADLSEADLHGADLSDADLRHADLSKANLQDTDLRGADLGGAALSGADLSSANLESARISQDQLEACASLFMSMGAANGSLTRGT